MWQFIIHSPDKEPQVVELKPGTLTLGRADTNDVVVDDISASRQHAEIIFDPSTNTLSLIDLNSTNGTYVNHQRVYGTTVLQPDDLLRIGEVVMQLRPSSDGAVAYPPANGTHRFTRELLLESLDEHSVQVYEAARKLNNVLTIKGIIEIITSLLKQSLAVNYCEIIMNEKLVTMGTADFIDPLAKKAARHGTAEVTSTAMFVPIISAEELLGLICLVKSRPETNPFDSRNLHLVVAISHQAALAIQRVQLVEKVNREEQVQRLLLRFVSPTETEFLLKDYFENGELPGLKEQNVTVLFSDIANSTWLAENLGTEHFSKILNGFYKVATDVIFAYKGMVKYYGDGILAIFPEQNGSIPAEEKAILVGRELVNMLIRTGSLDPTQRIVIGVAINTGKTMIGYVGTKDRAEFTALGDTVNAVLRMQEFARPYRIIAGQATVDALNGKYRFEHVGTVNLRGRDQTVDISEVLP